MPRIGVPTAKNHPVAWTMVVAACLSACGCGETDEVVTLWHQMRPADRAVLSDRIAEFERQNPGVDVRELYKETEELRSGLESAVLVGQGPDIVYGPSDPLGVYQAIGAVQDLSRWFPEEEAQRFAPEALVRLPNADGQEQLLMVGDRFGNHLALVYNRDLIASPPKTTDDLLRLAREQTIDEDNDGRPDRYGLVWNYTEPFFVVPFLTGYGAWVFEEGGQTPALDTPESVAGYRFVANLRFKEEVLPESADYEAASSLFLAGKAAMMLNGDWSWQQYLQAEGIDAAVAPLPVVSATGLPMAPMVAPKGYSLSVATQGERAELAGRLIRFLTSESTQREFLRRQKIVPSRLAVREDPFLREDPTLVASLDQIRVGRPMPTAVEMRAVWDAMRPPYQELMAGAITPEQAAAKMQRAALAKIKTLTTTVEPDATASLVRFSGVALLLACVWASVSPIRRFLGDYGQNRLAYLFVAPAVVLILITVVFPLAYNVALSFSNMSLGAFHDPKVIGLHNYKQLIFGDQAAKFWGVFGTTMLWTVVNVALHVAIGVFLAVVLNRPLRGRGAYRIALIIPWAVPAYITALTWRGMFDFQFGSVNQLLGLVGLPAVTWLTEANNTFAACLITNVWLGFPFMMVVALGGLQGIPQDLYEAARIDRATPWQQFWNVTVPMLRPVMLPAITLGAVWTFNNLNVIWLVSNGGEPADQTHILVSYVYKAVFNQYQYGYGAALSMVIFGILLTFSLLFLTRTRADQAVT